MKISIEIFKGKAVVIASVIMLLAVSVLAGTVYAVTLDRAGIAPVAAKTADIALGAQADENVGNGSYTITVKTSFESGVAEQTQKIEFFADGNTATAADFATLGDDGEKVFTANSFDTTPTLNLKNSADARISSVVITDADGSDITTAAFGSQNYYNNFIESCKTSLFGYVELQNITGNITVNVTYDTPVTCAMLGYNENNDAYVHATGSGNDESNPKFYSITIVAKGDVGPIDGEYQSTIFGPVRRTYNLDTGTVTDYNSCYYSYNNGTQYNNGFQKTVYAYCNPQIITVDRQYFSYIESIKLYDNATGQEITDVDFSSVMGKKSSSSQTVNYTFDGNENRRNITYVITYKNYNAGNRDLRMNITSVNSSEHGNNYYLRDIDSTSSGSFPYGTRGNFNNNGSSAGAFGEGSDKDVFIPYSRDSLRLYHDTYRVDYGGYYKNFRVFRMDTGEDVTELLTFTYGENNTTHLNAPYVDISGLSQFDDAVNGKYVDLYLTGECENYRTNVKVTPSGFYQEDFTITANGGYAWINDGTSYTYAVGSTDRYTNFAAHGSQYTISYSGANQKLAGATLSYTDLDGIAHTDTFNSEDNGATVKFTMPNAVKNNNSSNSTVLTVRFEDVLEAPEAQIFMGVNDTIVNDRGQVKLTTTDGDSAVSNIIKTNQAGTTQNSIASFAVIGGTSSLSSTYYGYYHILEGSKVTVEDVFFSSAAGEGWKKFCDDRFELTGVKVYKVNTFNHDGSGTATFITDESGNREEVEVTKLGDEQFSFTMPDCPVRIQPVYKDHIRNVNLLVNDNKILSTRSGYTPSPLGTATLTGADEDGSAYFVIDGFILNSSYAGSAYYARTQWQSSDLNNFVTVDGKTFTLTATPADSSAYQVSRVEVYKYKDGTNSNYQYFNKVQGSVGNWAILDSEGNEQEAYPNVSDLFDIQQVGDVAADGTKTYTIKFPSDLDFGNVAIMVYFEPLDTINFAHFKYEHDTTSEVPFNQYVTLKGVFGGENETRTEVEANHGADVEAAVYNDYSKQYMNVVLGGNTVMNSAFYRYNLLYTLSDYTTGEELVKFRVYKDQVLPIGNYTSEQLNQYVNVSGCTFEDAGSSTPYVCEKAAIPIKLTANGLKLSYQSERLYIPVTVKQYVKDSNGDYQAADSTFTATLTKYFEDSNGISDFAVNKYFAKAAITDENYGDSYGLNTAPYSDFTDTYTSTGAEESHFMLIENHLASWQGFHIQPNAPEGYRVASTGMAIKTYNSKNVQSSWGAFITTNQNIYDEGLGYRVQYHAENGQSMDRDYLTHMGGQRVEISLYYEPTEDTFALFHYNNSDAGFKPLVTLKGTFQYETSDTVTMTNSKTTVQTAVYDESAENPKLLTVEIGGGSESDSIFHQTNLVYTLTDRTTGDELLKFRIYRGQVEPVEGYTQAQFDKYIASASVAGYNTGSISGLLEKATLQIKMPASGLDMTYTEEVPYLPVTVKQFVIDSEGNVTAAGESFSSTVTKYYTGSDELGKKKYFYANTSVTDTYKMWNANESEFVDSYTVTGAGDTHNMIFINTYSGLYINPAAPEGYALATIQGKAFNLAGDEITYDYHKQQWTNIPTDHNNSGYLITHNYSSYAYLRGATLEVDVYYRPLTTLTIKQEMDGTLENDTLATVTITNTGTLSSPYKAYTDLDSKLVDSVTLTDNKSNVTETDDDHIGSLFRTSVLGVHQGVLPQIRITPSGARNVSSVKISKKSGDEYVEIPSTAYTVEGDGKTNSYITYTLTDAVEFGEDYLVEIVYGRQQNLTVEAVIRDASGNETIVNSQELYNQSCLDVISVTGQRYGATGEDIEEYAFGDVNNPSEQFDSFNVTTAPHTVNSATNTKVTIDTSFNANSDYVIANVVAYNDKGSALNLVVPGTKEKNGNSGVTYESVTLPSLTSSDNVTVKIILTKVATVKVNVFTILEDGTSIKEGTPDGVNKSDAYVNVAVKSNGINQKAIITEEKEGGYYTGDFDITYDPHSRTVRVLEGSKLEVFAQLPGNGEYVVSKITTNGGGYQNITVESVSQEGQNLRETLNTNSTTIVSGKEYELNIYIQQARSIYTRVVRDMGDDREAAGNGTVTMRGTHDTAGVIPFTKLVPIPNSAQHPNYYDAQYGGNNFTSEAKAVRDTHVSFEVTPPSQYGIKTVTVKSGTTRENAVAVGFTTSAPDSSGKVTYTVAEPMSPNNDLFVDVSFAILETATVTVDFQYTDDYEHYYNLFDPNEGLSTMNVRVSDGYYGTPLQVAKNLVTGEEKFSWEDITYSFSDTPNYQFEVAAGNQLSVSSTAYINGRWYEGIQGQCGVFDEQGTRIERQEPTLGQYAGIDRTVWAGQRLVFKIRLAPASTIGAVEVDCNSYNDNPSNARKSDSGSTIINATPPQVSTPIAITNAMRVWPSGSWTNSNSFGYNGEILMDSTIDSIDIDKTMVDPGEIRSVILYEFNKGVISDHHYDNPYSDVSPHLHESDEDGYTRKWEFSSAVSADERYYHFIPNGGSITVKEDKSYRAVVLYDLITVYSYTNYGGYVKQYLYYGSKEPKDINMFSESSADYTVLTGSNRFADRTVNTKTNAYYVLVSDLPKEDLSLNSASFEDYIESASTVDIKQNLLDSYTTRTHNGITKYYYFYEINRDDAYPVDNSMRLYSYFTMRRDDPPVIEESLDCDIAVEQWNRDTYDGNYVAASNQSAEFSVEEGKVLKLGNKAGADQNPITITTATGSMYSNRKQVLTIKPNPAAGYNVEKVVITDYGTGTYYPDSNGEIKRTLGSSDVTIRIYYSRPLLRISSTNEGNQGKATVDVYNSTTQSLETILTENKFTNGTFVTKGDNAEVIIKPLTYEDEGKDYYYTVASIRIGDAYNNTFTAYTEDGGDVEGDAFTVEKMADGSQYKLTINNMTKDKYVFIQLVGKEKIYISNLQVNQQIKLAGSSEYVDCFEGCFGSVTVNGALGDEDTRAGKDTPLTFDGTGYASFTFNDKASIEGTVLSETTISLTDIAAPEDYVLKSVEVVRNGASASVTESNGIYTLNNPAPDSGTTVITVKYALPTTPYTLTYTYQGRKGGNDGSYTGDNAENDEKTYTVNVDLYPADLTEDGKPTQRAIADNAPAVDDIYKDCKWTITGADSDTVKYDTENNKVDVAATQTPKTYNVEFFFTTGKEKADAVLSGVTLNSLAKDNEGKFIQAPETSGGKSFAYWSVEENGEEIAKCYSRDFNLRVTGNYKITALYTEKATVLSISDPRYTRQQYDSNGDKVDKLQVDFLLAYMESNGLLLNSESAAEQGYNSGIVVEYFDDCAIEKEDEIGGTLTDDDKARVILPETDNSALKSFVESSSNSSTNEKQHLLKYIVPNSYYNNKNRVDRVINFNNSEDARHMVFRAYYYVSHKEGENTITELTAPVTFYLYDIGNSQSNTEEG